MEHLDKVEITDSVYWVCLTHCLSTEVRIRKFVELTKILQEGRSYGTTSW